MLDEAEIGEAVGEADLLLAVDYIDSGEPGFFR